MQSKSTPTVSVVIAAYNAEDFIADAVESVLVQTLDDLELIVVNDGSTDRTREILENYEADSRMQVIDQANAGCSAARNHGAMLADGKFVAIVDADDICWPRKLELQVRTFEDDDTLGVVGTHARMVDQDGQPLGVLRPSTEPSTIARRMQTTMEFCHPTIMVRRDVFEELGGYNESYPTSEDYEFLRRIVDRYRARNIGRPLYDLRFHGGNKSFYYFEQQRLRGFLTRYFIDSGEEFDEEKYGGDLSRDQLIDIGISEKKIDHSMIANYIHRIQMLQILGRPSDARDFLNRALAYAERHQLGGWAFASLAAAESLMRLSDGRWPEALKTATSALVTDPESACSLYYKTARTLLHRWHTVYTGPERPHIEYEPTPK